MEENPTVCKLIEGEDFVEVKFRLNDQIIYKKFDFNNYFYIKFEEFNQVSHVVTPRITHYKIVVDRNNDEYVRLYLKNNFHRNLLRNEIEELGVNTYEADINSTKRLLIDNPNFDLNQEGLRIAFMDIETDDSKPFVKDRKGDIVPLSAITSIAVKEFIRDGDGKVVYFRNKGLDGKEFDPYRRLKWEHVKLRHKELPTIEIAKQLKEWEEIVTDALWEGEAILLDEYFKYIIDFDVVSAWNSRGFDSPYIRFRAKAHKVNSDKLLNLVDFDFMECYENHYTPIKSFALNNISYEELKSELKNKNSKLKNLNEIKKLDWKKSTLAQKYFELFLLYPKTHMEYNIQDVQLLDMLEKKLNFFKLHFVQSKKAHCLLIETLYNSKVWDVLILNKCKSRKIIKISKPTEQEVKLRENTIPPGGYTFCYKKGLYWDIKCFDFASHYAQLIRTFNLSRETYLRSEMPYLRDIFTDNEIEYISYCIGISKKYINKSNLLLKAKYEKDIEDCRIEMGISDTMEKLMWRFVRDYDQKINLNENESSTPADINRDTRGWNIHKHQIFSTNERGIMSEIVDDFSIERDRVKYSLKDYEKGSFEYQENFLYQTGLKLLNNSGFGFTLFRGSRDYLYELGSAITTAGRYFLKICILELQKNDMKITNGDTDSCYCIGTKSIEYLDNRFKELINEKIKPFNTMIHNGVNHTINFEYEDTYDAMIPIARKRYYYLKDGKINGKGGVQTKSNILKLSKDLQKELLEDIFYKKFSKEEWKEKLIKLKTKTLNYELEEEHIVKIGGIGRNIDSYGKAVIDGSTGLQKLRKSDGQPMFSPIPAVIQIAKRLIEEGENINVGDKIKYIVLKEKPIVPITLKEFRKNKKYDSNYYYDSITRPIIEILKVTNPQLVYTYFADSWIFTKRQLLSLESKLNDDNSEDDGDDSDEE